MKKSRQIIIKDETGKQRIAFYCDTTDCNDCAFRFQCFTSRSDIIATYPLATIMECEKKITAGKWRLRDGSSRFRANR